MKKTLLGILLTIASCVAASLTLQWDPNPSTDQVDHYRLFRAVNGGSGLPTTVTGTQFTYTDIAPGNSYQFWATAVGSNQLESAASAILNFTPPPLPPPISITSAKPSGAINNTTWTGVIVNFGTVNLSLYSATNYVITASSTNGTVLGSITSPTSPVTFPALTVEDLVFSASVTNITGPSPAGGTIFLSGKVPAVVTNVKVQTGP
jgi:hypothetical protein